MPVIEKLLVANRGEIARRVMHSARRMGISCVAVASDPDMGLPHVAEADEVVRLPGAAAADTYLRADLLVEAARMSGADAVHPGYGFLSENAGFARACGEAGLVFVGPPPEVIEAMGSKLAAKATMAGAGVPVLPSIEVPAELAAGNGQVPKTLRARLAEVGWPVLVKASAGGGGRGMRVVHDEDALSDALASASREAFSAFGDGTVFIEPYVSRPRHVEVQVVGDTQGTIVHLFERECSIQRRHQKIVEESPSPAVDPALRNRLGEAAVTAGRAIGYVNAGTVEFLLLPDGSFAFLEVNTRLQVEHPVTEMVTGLDLVALQLRIAEGHRLPEEVRSARIDGHAIEVRLYAEDPTHNWRPSAGRWHRLVWPAEDDGLRVDRGFETGSEIGPYYDPMLAKVIAHAPSRPEAARRLAGALAGAEIHGPVTNRDLLVRILRHPEFLAGEIDTAFLERHDPAELGAPLAGPEARRLHAVVAALAAQAERRQQAKILRLMPSGWRNNPAGRQEAEFRTGAETIAVGYGLERGGHWRVEVDGSERQDVAVVRTDPDAVTMAVNGVGRRYQVQRVDALVYVDGPEGASVLEEIERFPLPGSQLGAGSLVAPLPGTVVKVHVGKGDQVEKGDTLMAIEAMKMEHEIHAPVSGVVAEVHVAAGDQVEAGRLLVVVEEAT
jgi:propionyl-CoA carboxylase alpha chain